MASGTLIQLNGGFNMRQVISGDEITITEFNNARLNVDRMLGPTQSSVVISQTSSAYHFPTSFINSTSGANTYGYGQGGASVSAVVADMSSVQAINIRNLQIDVQNLCNLLGITQRNRIDQNIISGDVILVEFWNNLMLNIKDCWDNRFNIQQSTGPTNPVSDTFTRGRNAQSRVDYTFRWEFTNEEEMYRFLVLGGTFGVEIEAPPDPGIYMFNDENNYNFSFSEHWSQLYQRTIFYTGLGGNSSANLPQIEPMTHYRHYHSRHSQTGARVLYSLEYRGLRSRHPSFTGTRTRINTFTVLFFIIEFFRTTRSLYLVVRTESDEGHSLPVPDSTVRTIKERTRWPSASWFSNPVIPTVSFFKGLYSSSPSSFRD